MTGFSSALSSRYKQFFNFYIHRALLFRFIELVSASFYVILSVCCLIIAFVGICFFIISKLVPLSNECCGFYEYLEFKVMGNCP